MLARLDKRSHQKRRCVVQRRLKESQKIEKFRKDLKAAGRGHRYIASSLPAVRHFSQLQLHSKLMRVPGFIAALLAALPLSVAADIYACKTAAGTIVYQNFTCDRNSSGVVGPAKTTQPGPPTNAAKSTAASVPKSAAAPLAHKVSSASSEPRLGMSAEQVRAIWGEPANVYQDELVDGRVEIWGYDGGRYVHFNALHRAVLIDR